MKLTKKYLQGISREILDFEIESYENSKVYNESNIANRDKTARKCVENCDYDGAKIWFRQLFDFQADLEQDKTALAKLYAERDNRDLREHGASFFQEKRKKRLEQLSSRRLQL